jgi:hypothetical protein
MKYICLGYLEPGTFEEMSEDERRQNTARASRETNVTRELPDAGWQGRHILGILRLCAHPGFPGLARRSGRQNRTFSAKWRQRAVLPQRLKPEGLSAFTAGLKTCSTPPWDTVKA